MVYLGLQRVFLQLCLGYGLALCHLKVLIILLFLLFQLVVALFILMLSLGYDARPLELPQLGAWIFLQIIHHQL